MNSVATGEHWFGQQALHLNLVDEIMTSDDVLLKAMKEKHVIGVKYSVKKSLLQKFGKQAEESADNVLLRLLKRNENGLM